MMRTFYSSSGNLCFRGSPPERKQLDGELKLIEGVIVEFTPIGREAFGILTTDDPVKIAACEARMKSPGDVFEHGEFLRRSMTPDQRAKVAEEGNLRLIEEKNRLMAEIERLKGNRQQQSSAR